MAANELQQSKQDFLVAVGQYLDEPVSAMIGLTELLQDRNRDSSAGVRNQLIDLLGLQAGELSAMLNNLQVLAKADLGELGLKREPVDLRDVVDEAAGRWASEQRKRFTVSGDGVAIGDPTRLVHIVENLLRHASESDGSSVSVRISTEPKRVVVEVADDGFHLDEYSMKRIFEADYTRIRSGAHKSTLALGLSVAHRLARAQGGDLSYRRAEGENILELRLPIPPGPISTPHHEDTTIDPLLGRPSKSTIAAVIADGGPSMVYQPIVDISEHGDLRIIGYESLARFPHSSPPEWFEVADKTGSRFDLELAAISAAVAGFDGRAHDGFLALNLSDQTLISPKLGPALGEIDPGRVVLELSEVAAVKSYEMTSRAMRALRERGVRLAVDDVGVGEIDLWHILRLDPDVVKIDTCLVRDIEHSPRNAALVRGICAMCADLGIMVVAESVETLQERDALAELGVGFAQGYLFGKPGPLRWQSKILSAEPALRDI